MEQAYEYLLNVYKYGSIAKAATAMHVTSPTISIAIRKIEEKLNTDIFDRESHPLKLTPSGELYLNFIKSMKQEEEITLSKINDLLNMDSGVLKIGGTQHCTACVLPSVLEEFNKRYPHITIEIYDSPIFRMTETMESSNLDVGICFDQNTTGDYYEYKVAYDDLLISIPRKYITDEEILKYGFTRNDVISGRHYSFPAVPSLDFMEKMPFIGLYGFSGDIRHELAVFHKYHIDLNFIAYVTQMQTGHQLSARSIGACMTSSTVIKQNLPSDNVLFFRFDDPLVKPEAIYALIPKKKYITPPIKRFMLLCKELEDRLNAFNVMA